MTLCSRCGIDVREMEGFISVRENMWRSCDEIQVPIPMAEGTFDFCSYSCLLAWYK